MHDETGWLVDADAESLIKQVVALCQEPDQVKSVRQNLSSIEEESPRDMVSAYNRCCPPKKQVQPFRPVEAELSQVQRAAAEYQHTFTETELRKACEKQKKLAIEIDQIANWAKQERKSKRAWEKEAERLRGEFEAKAAWALQLSQDLEQERKSRALWVEHLEIEVNMFQKRLHETYGELQHTRSELQGIQSELRGQVPTTGATPIRLSSHCRPAGIGSAKHIVENHPSIAGYTARGEKFHAGTCLESIALALAAVEPGSHTGHPGFHRNPATNASWPNRFCSE